MKLKMTTNTILRVEYQDLDKFINKIYDLDKFKENDWRPYYEFVQDYCSSNDVSHDFPIFKKFAKKYIGKYEEDQLEDFKNGKLTGGEHFMTGTLLLDLCRRDLIPEGNYLIEVCW